MVGSPKPCQLQDSIGRENFDSPSCPICRNEWQCQVLEGEEYELKKLKRKEIERQEFERRSPSVKRTI
jgi:hypothetical protein